MQIICTLMPLNDACFCRQYPALSVKRTTKSWRHPLRKPTARAVPTAVKQQAASDDGGHTHAHTRLSCITCEDPHLQQYPSP